ncbi:MAG: mechanosensitive ion channel [Bacteroidia bacterium]|nr:mechanosensitive ion channel [Bacteroidia bacterium]
MDDFLTFVEKAVQLYALNIVLAIVIFLVGLWLAGRLRNGLKKLMRRRQVDETLTKFAGSVIYATFLIFVIIAALGQLGIQTTSLIAILGAAGLAIGLALQGSLSNLASGVMLIVLRPFSVGHYIEGAGIAGTVRGVQLFTTTLMTPDNRRIIVPNSKLTNDNIINYTIEEKRRIDFFFSVAYNDDIRRAQEVMLEVLHGDARVLDDPEATVGVFELGDNAVKFAVRPWVKTEDYWPVYFDMMQTMKRRLTDEGFNIPFPQRDVHLYHHRGDAPEL